MKKLFAAAIMSVILAATGCRHVNTNVNVNGISGSTISYENSDKYKMVSGIETASGDIKDLDINWIGGDITLEYADVDRLTFFEDIAEDASDAKRMYVYERNGRLSIQYGKAGRWDFDGLRKSLTIQVPRDASFSEISIDSVSSSIEMCGLTIGELSWDTVSGDFHMTENGNIAEIDVSSVSGEFNYTGSLKHKADIETVSGNTSLQLTGLTGYEVDMDSVSGDFNSNVAYEVKDEDTYLYGDRSLEIDCESVSGSLTVEAH